jgi:hypothetical protein
MEREAAGGSSASRPQARREIWREDHCESLGNLAGKVGWQVAHCMWDDGNAEEVGVTFTGESHDSRCLGRDRLGSSFHASSRDWWKGTGRGAWLLQAVSKAQFHPKLHLPADNWCNLAYHRFSSVAVNRGTHKFASRAWESTRLTVRRGLGESTCNRASPPHLDISMRGPQAGSGEPVHAWWTE